MWLWLQAEPERVRPDVLHQLADASNELLLSAASSWELAIKYELGMIALPEAPAVYVSDRLRRSGTTPSAVEHGHVLPVADLPPHHRDPSDRVLVAQATVLGIPLVTSDERLAAYDVEVIAV